MTISVRHEAGEGGHIRRVHGEHTEGLRDARFSLTEKNLAGVLYAKGLCFSRDFSNDRYEIRYFKSEPRSNDFVSFLAVPFGVHECRGMILMESYSPNASFSDSLRRLVSRIATSAGLAMERVLLLENANAMAIHDGLTGLINHRHFQHILKDEIARSRRYGDPLSAGALQYRVSSRKSMIPTATSSAILSLKPLQGSSDRTSASASIRQPVTAARSSPSYLSILTKRQATEMTEHVRGIVENSPFAGTAGNEVRVTISSALPGSVNMYGTCSNNWIKRADTALYRAKECGTEAAWRCR